MLPSVAPFRRDRTSNKARLTTLFNKGYTHPSLFHPSIPALLPVLPFLCLHASHESWSLPSQPIKLTAIIAAVADPTPRPLLGKVIYNGRNVRLLTAQWSRSHSHTHTCSRARAQARTYNAYACLAVTTFLWHLAFMSHFYIYLKWGSIALKNFSWNSIPLNCYRHICSNRIQDPTSACENFFCPLPCTLNDRVWLCPGMCFVESGWRQPASEPPLPLTLSLSLSLPLEIISKSANPLSLFSQYFRKSI